MVDVFCWTDIPYRMLTDQGIQTTGALTREPSKAAASGANLNYSLPSPAQ